MEVELRLGIVHHVLFPDRQGDPQYHERTLRQLLSWPEFAVVEAMCTGEPQHQQAQANLLRESGKQVIYHLPLLCTVPGCDPNAGAPNVVQRTQTEVRHHLDLAAVAGAKLVVVASGRNPIASQRTEVWRHWLDFLGWLGKAAAIQGLQVAVEPFDQSIGKNLLVGSTKDAARSVELAHIRGVPNLGLLLDMAHLTLNGENFADGIRIAGQNLWHVHLANVVMRDPDHEYYGDQHPPFAIAGSEHSAKQIATFITELAAANYFARPDAAMSFEVQPYPGLAERDSALRWIDTLNEACALIAEAQEAEELAAMQGDATTELVLDDVAALRAAFAAGRHAAAADAEPADDAEPAVAAASEEEEEEDAVSGIDRILNGDDDDVTDLADLVTPIARPPAPPPHPPAVDDDDTHVEDGPR